MTASCSFAAAVRTTARACFSTPFLERSLHIRFKWCRLIVCTCIQATCEGGDAPQVTFADDCQVADEYETDSGDDFSAREDEDIAPVTVSRSGRPILTCPFWA